MHKDVGEYGYGSTCLTSVILHLVFTFINARLVGVLEEQLLGNPVLVVGLVDAAAAAPVAVEAVVVVAEEVVIVVRGVSGGRRGRRR